MLTAEDKAVGWHHRLNGSESEQTLGDGERQRSLVCCSPRGHKESDMTELLTVLYLNQENAPEGTKKSQIHREGTLVDARARGWGVRRGNEDLVFNGDRVSA